MDKRAFYNFRKRMRRKLGRILFYPENIKIYDETVQLIVENENIFKEYLKYCTDNEQNVLMKLSYYLRDTEKNSVIKTLIEEGME